MLSKIASDLESEGLYKPFENTLQELRTQWEKTVTELRVICLTKHYDVSVMWAHYADEHRGIVIGLECADSSHGMAWLMAKKVTYTNEPPPFSSLEGLAYFYLNDRTADMFEENCFVKAKDWVHEREWRALTHKREYEEGLFSDWGYAARGSELYLLRNEHL